MDNFTFTVLQCGLIELAGIAVMPLAIIHEVVSLNFGQDIGCPA
jgi:hypothetical protein